jgi:polysaccharide deacetylase family protein (PEP-CTERM system associated)
MNILTIDVEEWFQFFDVLYSNGKWKNYEVRIYENVERIFRLLEDTNTKATFFIVGWIAKEYPDLVRRISEKYEIGSHTLNHGLVWQQNRSEFKEDVSSSIKLLEDISGKPIKYFRAPGFSIRESEGWAFEVLKECGIEIDCSVFPAHHAHGGIPNYGDIKPSIISYNGIEIKELPVSIKKIVGKNIIFSGGGYFRLFPYCLIKSWTKEMDDYLISYIHPRDLDYGQPLIKDLSLLRKFKSYYGLKGAEDKLRLWLNDFEFVDIDTANKSIDWSSAPIVHL